MKSWNFYELVQAKHDLEVSSSEGFRLIMTDREVGVPFEYTVM